MIFKLFSYILIIAPFPLAHPHTSVWLSVLFLILFSHTFSAVFHPLLFLQPISTDWWIPNISHWFTSLRLHSPLFSSSKRSIYLEIHQCISKYTHPLLFFSLSILSQLKMKLSLKKIYIYIYIYFWPYWVACGILVPQTTPPALKVWVHFHLLSTFTSSTSVYVLLCWTAATTS